MRYLFVEVRSTGIDRPLDQLGYRRDLAGHHLQIHVGLEGSGQVRAIRVCAEHIKGFTGEFHCLVALPVVLVVLRRLGEGARLRAAVSQRSVVDLGPAH